MKPTYVLVATSAASVTAGLGLGWLAGSLFQQPNNGYALRDTDAPYAHVEPLIACNVGASVESASLHDLQSQMADIIDEAVDRGDAEQASVYFRNLNSGEWTAVNLDHGYSPASLMKLPILMAYLKQAERSPELLEETVTVETDPAPKLAQDIPPEKSVEVGKTYTIDELLELMIVYSDNRALELLMRYIDADVLHELLEDLGLPQPGSEENYTLTARTYSRFFRTLYNGTYLSPAMSEKALGLLINAEFADGLVAGVPKGTDVAHKFGEASTDLGDGSTGHELHDCGIVYSDTPYVMCVMTRGADVDDLGALIADVSAAAYAAAK